jgi:hypothetical protein
MAGMIWGRKASPMMAARKGNREKEMGSHDPL